jgi:hypothetical protein
VLRVELRTSESVCAPASSLRPSQGLPPLQEPQAPDSSNTHKEDGGNGDTPHG